MKILICTDNHLGYKERDPVLFNDSFDTFEEILIHAKTRNVDLILQAGDLFHENRPSRSCLTKTISLLKKYCSGNKIYNFSCTEKLNIDDPNLCISLPIISIHGNHDDPSGIFATSPMHILKSTNLINYLGFYYTEKIELNPVIMHQKNISLAIYCLGHIRDRKVYKMFLQKKITFVKPKEKCFCIFMTHQNRIEYRNQDYLPHEFLPPWLDLIIWGHEHESIVLMPHDFIILQAGSSVRTSLCEKETFDKFTYILDIETNSLDRILLRTTRNFIMDEIEPEYDEEVESKIDGMLKTLKKKKTVCLHEDDKYNQITMQRVFNGHAFNNFDFVNVQTFSQTAFINEEELLGLSNQDIKLEDSVDESKINENINLSQESIALRFKELLNIQRIPLVRLKVLIKNNYTINKHKIQSRYKEIIANWSDLLLLKRQKQETIVSMENKPEMNSILIGHLEFKAMNVSNFLCALESFVEKDDKNAFGVCIKNTVDKLLVKMLDDLCDDFDSSLVRARKDIELENMLKGDDVRF